MHETRGGQPRRHRLFCCCLAGKPVTRGGSERSGVPSPEIHNGTVQVLRAASGNPRIILTISRSLSLLPTLESMRN